MVCLPKRTKAFNVYFDILVNAWFLKFEFNFVLWFAYHLIKYLPALIMFFASHFEL